MKLFYFLISIILLISCDKRKEVNGQEVAPQETEEEKLQKMRTNIIKDWKIKKMVIVEPRQYYGNELVGRCTEYETFSFKNDSTFSYSDTCSKIAYRGWWRIPNTDSLYNDFWNGNISAYMELEIAKLTADTMRWRIRFSGSHIDGSPYIGTAEYTLIPK